MKQTPNYNLPQFDGADYFNKEILNDAFSKIDTGISDIQETINNSSGDSLIITQEIIEARKGKNSLAEKIGETDLELTKLKGFLNYMPINGGTFEDIDGNQADNISIDGGIY